MIDLDEWSKELADAEHALFAAESLEDVQAAHQRILELAELAKATVKPDPITEMTKAFRDGIRPRPEDK